ncbi:MFS transporter [Tessaracoccus antarcticus]|uniref:MFS transporter n=1 Tax=Tessaracoccus antarcticus TaxID=2479848 RepID=UPI0018F68428|nr:MFS transporter [Tessaracoccus antarcticus]
MTFQSGRATATSRPHSTLWWVLGITLAGLVFDGYDLVVYGAVMPEFRKPGGLIHSALSAESQAALTASAGVEPGALTPAMQSAIGEAASLGGVLGSCALFGVLVGALLVGAVGDRVGRRRPMLVSIAWLSIGMALTALSTSAVMFGTLRFVTGLGIGALVATTAAVVSEFAPRGRKNVANAVVYSGVPLGSTLSALAAILLLEPLGWRGLFLLGALPLITLLPVAWFKLPESPVWLESRSRRDLSGAVGSLIAEERVGFAGLIGRRFLLPTILLGMLSATGLLLVYSLNTWLPQLTGPLLGSRASLALLLALNLGAVVGGLFGSTLADRWGARPVIAGFFTVGGLGILLVTATHSPDLIGLLLVVIGVVGMGTSGTQTLIYGFVANYYPTSMRAAAVAWCAGFGRLGGVAGPIVGGMLAAAFPTDPTPVFWVLAGVCGVGVVICLATPARPPCVAPPETAGRAPGDGGLGL